MEGPVHYEICIGCVLDERWSSWFEGLTVTSRFGGQETVIAGPLADQAALHGVLERIRDLGLPLISLRRIGDVPTDEDSPDEERTPS